MNSRNRNERPQKHFDNNRPHQSKGFERIVKEDNHSLDNRPGTRAPPTLASAFPAAILKKQVGAVTAEAKKNPVAAHEAKPPSAPEQSKDVYDYGIILNIRPAFGFIQSIFSDESFYFSEREFYRDAKMGDLVTYVVRNGPKGLAAQNVRQLSTTGKGTIATVKGTISRAYDRHRSNHGLVEVDAASLATLPPAIKDLLQKRYQNLIPFHHTMVLKDTIPKNHFLDRGDYVEFSLVTIEDNVFYVAQEMKFLQLKRDRLAALQIQRMLEAGAVRELGVISAVKNQEYGFIRAQDRKDEIYFRCDDIVIKDEDNNAKSPAIKEGVEVEFFVIAEMIRGKLCERAIHLSIIPTGTVQFEIVVKNNISIQVLLEPGLPPADEIPGSARLLEPNDDLDVENFTKVKNMKIKQIDLWSRCMPDDLLVRKGDTLLINIHYYRPEKIFFARNVRIVNYFPLGRNLGTIVTMKEGSFGFIKSEILKCDLYFKTNQVVGSKGGFMSEQDLKRGSIVSFDCAIEDGSKLRAVRVQYVAENENILAANSGEDFVLERNILGVVVRHANKRDTVGLIKVSPSRFKELSDLVFYDPSIIESLAAFEKSDIPSLEVTLPASQIKLFHEICDSKFPKLGHETINSASSSELKPSKLWKKTETELQMDSEAPKLQLKSFQRKDSPSFQKLNKDGTVSFVREDYVTEELGPLMNDMEVIFDLAWDRSKNKKVAKNIRLTDEPVESASNDPLVAVIDTVIPAGQYKSGFLRSLKSDEKIFWMMKSDNNTAENELAPESEVSYELRKRGGLHCAVNIKALPKGSLSQEVILSSNCTALVVNTNEVVLLDTSNESEIAFKYVDMKLLETLIALNTSKGEAVVAPAASSSISPTPESGDIAANESKANETSEKDNSATTSSSEGINEKEITSSTNEERIEYKANYFPPLPRSSIPVRYPTTSSITENSLKIGDVVSCQVIMNLAMKRSPVSVQITEVLTSITATKKKGRIINLKYRLKSTTLQQITNPINSNLTPDQLKRYRLTELDWTEVQEIPEKRATPLAEDYLTNLNNSIKPYHCLYQEIQPGAGNIDFNRETLENGEEIEFWTLSNCSNLAFGVSVPPKKEIFGKTGPGFNDKLKSLKTSANMISMALGPPTDSAVGFEPGWRTVDPAVIAALPWAPLLAHLQA